MILAALSNEILPMLSDLYFHQFVCEIWKVIDEETASLGLVYYIVIFVHACLYTGVIEVFV